MSDITMAPETTSLTIKVSDVQTEGTSCLWEKLMPDKDSTSDETYQYMYTVTATAAILSSLYLFNYKDKFQLRNYAYNESYFLFTLFFLSMCGRLILPKICYLAIGYAKSEFVNCNACAMLDSFVTILEIETMTHVCIDRYVVAKYIYNGWPIPNRDYVYFYMKLVIFFATLYTLPPVFGLGEYALDLDCKTCTLNLILPKDWTRYIVVGIWFLRSVKPGIFMLVMLHLTRKLEAKFTVAMKLRSDSFFTTIIEVVTWMCVFFWTPTAFVKGWVIISQLQGKMELPSADWVQAAPILYEMSPILIFMTVAMANAGVAIVEKPFSEWVKTLNENERKKE